MRIEIPASSSARNHLGFKSERTATSLSRQVTLVVQRIWVEEGRSVIRVGEPRTHHAERQEGGGDVVAFRQETRNSDAKDSPPRYSRALLMGWRGGCGHLEK